LYEPPHETRKKIGPSSREHRACRLAGIEPDNPQDCSQVVPRRRSSGSHQTAVPTGTELEARTIELDSATGTGTMVFCHWQHEDGSPLTGSRPLMA